MTVREISRLLTAEYKSKGGKDFFTASDFISALFEKNGIDKNSRLSDPDALIGEDIEKKISVDARRLLDGYPIQYYLQSEYFCGYEFSVGENILIPRADTEVLVEKALPHIENITFADICCGSGCIGISLLKKSMRSKCISIDLSEYAVEKTKENSLKLDTADRMIIEKCDVFDGRIIPLLKKNDVRYIVSNPPYIESKEIKNLPKNVLNEPRIALDGGKDGLKFYRRLLDIAKELKIGFAFEIGYDQKESLFELCFERELNSECIKDLSGNDRVIISK